MAVVVQATGVQIAPTALGPLRIQGALGVSDMARGLVAWGLGGHSALQNRAVGIQGCDLICTQRLPKPEAGWLHRELLHCRNRALHPGNASVLYSRPWEEGQGKRKGWDPLAT